MGRRFTFNKTVEEYRRLAKECRETARTVSRENERSGLARESNELRIKLALIEMATELRVVAQHLQRDVLPRGPSHPRRLRLPADVLMRLRSGKG